MFGIAVKTPAPHIRVPFESHLYSWSWLPANIRSGRQHLMAQVPASLLAIGRVGLNFQLWISVWPSPDHYRQLVGVNQYINRKFKVYTMTSYLETTAIEKYFVLSPHTFLGDRNPLLEPSPLLSRVYISKQPHTYETKLKSNQGHWYGTQSPSPAS